MGKTDITYPPFKTRDGRTVQVGKVYFLRRQYGPIVPVKCVAENRAQRFWWGQRHDGDEVKIRVRHGDSVGVYSSLTAVKRANLAEARKSLGYARQSVRRTTAELRRREAEVRRIQAAISKAKG